MSVSPDTPLVCLIHPDLYSSQWNEAEADLVAGLVLTLHRRRLLNLEQDNAHAYDNSHFFRAGVGVVTPHRAQQAAVLDRLDVSLPPSIDRASLYGAVDTVERFQGQEKAEWYTVLADPQMPVTSTLLDQAHNAIERKLFAMKGFHHPTGSQ